MSAHASASRNVRAGVTDGGASVRLVVACNMLRTPYADVAAHMRVLPRARTPLLAVQFAGRETAMISIPKLSAQIDRIRSGNALADKFLFAAEWRRGVDAKPPPVVALRIAVKAGHIGQHHGARVGASARQIGPPHVVEVVDVDVVIDHDHGLVPVMVGA